MVYKSDASNCRALTGLEPALQSRPSSHRIMSPTPRLVVSNVDLDKDWDELFATYWNSWKHPLQAVGQLTFAGIGEGGEREANSFAQNKEEYLAAARASPTQIWLKVEDMTRRLQGHPAIVGGGAFTQCITPPFPGQGQPRESDIQLPGPSYPSGSERHGLVQELYSQMWSWRSKWINKPLSCKCLSPVHRSVVLICMLWGPHVWAQC